MRLCILLIWIPVLLCAQTPDRDFCRSDPWTLIFEDSFEGALLDTHKWTTYYPDGGSDQCPFCRRHDTVVSNQVYRDQNVVLQDGILRLIIRNEHDEWYGQHADYTAGVVHSKNLFYNELKYEIRAKVAKNLGSLSAFWIFGWHTEIDFFEMGRDKRMPFMTLHRWNGNSSVFDQYSRYKGPDFSKDYHVFTTIFDPDKIQFLIDGEVVHTKYRYLQKKGKKPVGVDVCKNPKEGLMESPYWPLPNMPCNVILSAAVGKVKKSRLFQQPNKHAVWPDTFHVDYIKIFKRSCLGFPATPTVIDQDHHWDWNLEFNGLEIRDGVTFKVSDCKINMAEGSRIKLGKGAKLILDNVELGSCDPRYRWHGIEAELGSEVKIINHSTIGDAVLLFHDAALSADRPIPASTPRMVCDGSTRFSNCLQLRDY